MSYDVIVVGARVAGSALAIRLARAGVRVLVTDRVRFPSDTLSTHQVQVPGVTHLRRLGVLDALLASGTPPTRTLLFDQGRSVLRAPMPTVDGVDIALSPRRTLLDAVLVEAARHAGAEVREGFDVEEVRFDAGRVTGIRGRSRAGGTSASEAAAVVVGADGNHSLVARSVAAPAYDVVAPRSMAAYGYWAGVPTDGGEIHTRPGYATTCWPTNDGLTMSYVGRPIAAFERFRANLDASFMAAMDVAGLGDRLRSGQRVERIRATNDLPAMKRRPYGPGWALVGDAGLTMDPISAQGITFALRDAGLLADALIAGLDHGAQLGAELRRYHRARDRAGRAMYDFTANLSLVAPPTAAEDALFAALADRPDATEAFVAAFTGAAPLTGFLSPRTIVGLVGVRGALALARQRARRSRMPTAAAA